MKNTISNLWNGNLVPIDDLGKNESEIEVLLDFREEIRKSFSEALSEKQKKAFENYVRCTEEYFSLANERAFASGFSVASKLLCEALRDNM